MIKNIQNFSKYLVIKIIYFKQLYSIDFIEQNWCKDNMWQYCKLHHMQVYVCVRGCLCVRVSVMVCACVSIIIQVTSYVSTTIVLVTQSTIHSFPCLKTVLSCNRYQWTYCQCHIKLQSVNLSMLGISQQCYLMCYLIELCALSTSQTNVQI